MAGPEVYTDSVTDFSEEEWVAVLSKLTQLFAVASLWELAMALASSFVGAWFWHIHTPARAIVTYDIILIAVMTGLFAWGSRLSRWMPSQRMMQWGITIYMIYLLLLMALGITSRQFYLLLALLNGISAGLYWLALYIATAIWVKGNEAEWYNSWIGVIENGFAIIAPPLAGWIITQFPRALGYQIVFGISVILLALAFGIVHYGEAPSMPVLDAPAVSETKDLWKRMTIAVTVLGLRDGVLFFIPSLYLFIATDNALLLGLYLTVQGGTQVLAFYINSRLPATARSVGLWVLALSLSFAATAALLLLSPISAIFVFGLFNSLSYPLYKVAIESMALEVIQKTGHSLEARTVLTSRKEAWLNGGRTVSLLILLLFMLIFSRHHLLVIRNVLAFWPLLTGLIYVSYRQAKTALANWEWSHLSQ